MEILIVDESHRKPQEKICGFACFEHQTHQNAAFNEILYVFVKGTAWLIRVEKYSFI